MSERKIMLVRPEIACLLKTSDRKSARRLMKDFGIDEAKMVVIPVNDTEQLEIWSSGNHWTVLVWDRETNTFSHIDSIPGQNAKHAKNLAADLLDGSWFNNDRNLQVSRMMATIVGYT